MSNYSFKVTKQFCFYIKILPSHFSEQELTMISHVIDQILTLNTKLYPTKSDDSSLENIVQWSRKTWDRRPGLLSLTCLPVIALNIDTEHRNPLPLHIVIIEVDIWDGDVPGWEVSRGAGGGCCLHGGVILQHHHGFLHLEWKEVRGVKVE